MKPGVYISKTPLPNLNLVSRGDYTNPITEVFQLRDSNNIIEKIITLYVIVYDIKIEFFKIEASGERMGIRLKFSLDQNIWNDFIYYDTPINALEGVDQVTFFLKIQFDDIIDLYNPYNVTQIKDFKLKLYYQ